MNKTRAYIFTLLMLIILASTVFSAELGAGKELKADKGPTLDVTTDFIKRMFAEFYIDKFSVDGEFGKYIISYPSVEIIIDGCNVKFSTEERSNGIVMPSSTAYKLGLSDITAVTVGFYSRQGIDRGSDVWLRDGKPVYAITLKEVYDKITEIQFSLTDKNKVYTSNIKYVEIPIKNQDYAKRLANAFERAVQLCGGGKDIGKEDVF